MFAAAVQEEEEFIWHSRLQLNINANCKNPDEITELHKNVSLFTSQME